MDPATLAAAVSSLVSLFSGGGNSPQNGLSQLDPRILNSLLQTMGYQNNRLASVEPIHNAAMAMAMRMAPGYAQQPLVSGAPAVGSGGGGSQPSTSTGGPSPATRSVQTPAAPLNLGHASNIYVDNGVLYINGRAYQIPGGSQTPVTGPEDPDPYHHPTNSDPSRPVSDAMQQFFFGNPGGAFVGGPGGGDGSQDYYGNVHAKAY